jgi:hypothetical protein
MQRSIGATGLLVSALWLSALGLPSGVRAEEPLTAGEFLAECDELNPDCRNQFVAGLEAVNEGGMACPPRTDVNTPISGWLAYMHQRVNDDPSLASGDMGRLQLTAFIHLWPCPK